MKRSALRCTVAGLAALTTTAGFFACSYDGALEETGLVCGPTATSVNGYCVTSSDALMAEGGADVTVVDGPLDVAPADSAADAPPPDGKTDGEPSDAMATDAPEAGPADATPVDGAAD
jgi:hypothetical protein